MWPKFNFGIHSGKPIDKVPQGYLRWFLATFEGQKRAAPMLDAIRAYLRATGSDVAPLPQPAIGAFTRAATMQRTTLSMVADQDGKALWLLRGPQDQRHRAQMMGWEWNNKYVSLASKSAVDAWRMWQYADGEAERTLSFALGDQRPPDNRLGHAVICVGQRIFAVGLAPRDWPQLLSAAGVPTKPTKNESKKSGKATRKKPADIGSWCAWEIDKDNPHAAIKAARAADWWVSPEVEKLIGPAPLRQTRMVLQDGVFRIPGFRSWSSFVQPLGFRWDADTSAFVTEDPIAAWRMWPIADVDTAVALEARFGLGQKPPRFIVPESLIYDRLDKRFVLVPDALGKVRKAGGFSDRVLVEGDDENGEDAVVFGRSTANATAAARLFAKVRKEQREARERREAAENGAGGEAAKEAPPLHVPGAIHALLRGRDLFGRLSEIELADLLDMEMEMEGGGEEEEEEDLEREAQDPIVFLPRSNGFRLGKAQVEFPRVLELRALCSQRAEIEVERRLLAAMPLLPIPEGPIPANDGLEYSPYQVTGIHFAAAHRRSINGDQMGLGKTVQAIGLINYVHPVRALIICPAMVRTNWMRESRLWLVGKTVWVVANGVVPDTDVVVASYEQVNNTPELARIAWGLVICDEAHYIKNPETIRYQRIAALNFDRLLLMTGTPIYNRPQDLFTLVNLCAPEAFPDVKRFCDLYAVQDLKSVAEGEGRRVENLEAIASMLRDHLMIRRTKKEVMRDLPPKRRDLLAVEVDPDVLEGLLAREQALADNMAAANRLQGRDRFNAKAGILAQISELRRDIGKAKLPFAIQYLTEVAENDDEPFIVFTYYRDIAFAITAALEQAGVAVSCLTGKMSADKRQAEVDKLQRGEIRVLVCTMSSCGVGLTMTASSRVFMVELDWSPSNLEQSEDRCHRRGARNAVDVYYMVVDRTIDARMAMTVSLKGVVAETALGDMVVGLPEEEAALDEEGGVVMMEAA